MRLDVRALWSPAAERDLHEIWLHFAAIASRDVADHLLRAIGDAVERIAEHPLAWQERAELGTNMRACPVHPYAIFYRIQAGNPEIVRILHERRDLGRAIVAPQQPI